jgi:FKBP-type peptidyl-prolyl cis-trans isomerase
VSLLTLLVLACSGGDPPPPPTDTPQADAGQDKDEKGKSKRKEIPAPEDVAAPPSDATKTASGLAYKVLTPGTGAEADKPTAISRVVVNYTGWTTDGKMFDSSESRGRPATFNLDAVVPGWTEGLQLMTTGQKNRLWIPEELAYKGQPGKPAGMLVFDIELVQAINPPPAPADVAAPPADAKKSPSGLFYKISDAGTGDDSPTERARVMVNFTVWKTDGTLVETTVTKGRPTNVQLNDKAMPGFVEAIQMLKRGGKGQFWLPQELAYKGEAGQARGHVGVRPAPAVVREPGPAAARRRRPAQGRQEDPLGPLVQGPRQGQGDRPPDRRVERDRPLHGLDDGRLDVRQLRPSRGQPADVRAQPGHPGLDQGRAADVQGREAPLLDPGRARVRASPAAPAGMLVFDVELLVVQEPPPIPAPPDVAAAPADATKTESGLMYKVLTPGEGAVKPEATSRVKVHYTGWTTDGKMFDSSVQRGEPAMFPLNGVIKGWTEGLQLMTEGQKNRFWIPADLAYGETPKRPGAPAGHARVRRGAARDRQGPGQAARPRVSRAPRGQRRRATSSLAT